MKKFYVVLVLLITAFNSFAAFVPDPSKLYNIKQTNSGLVIGAQGNTPCLQTVNQRASQAFSFIPVAGLTDTYYLRNEDGKYLNKVSTVSWDYWSVTYEDAPTGNNSEWVIEGEITGFRLMLTNNSKYLASDNTTNGAGIYCDKLVDNPNGLFALEEATVIYEVFEVAEKNMELNVEKDYLPYPINITTSGIFENIYTSATSGFTMDKTTITPEEVTAGSGKVVVKVSSTAPVGTKGHVYFSIGFGDDVVVFDSVAIKSVEKQVRYFILSGGDTSKVIGNHSTENAPALQVNTEDISQMFILREANPGVNDSLYYVIQDGSYKMIMKELSSAWNVVYGAPCEEAKWKITKETATESSFINVVTGKYLGADGLTPDSRLYDDKALVATPTEKPYTLWRIVNTASVVVPERFELSDNNHLLEVETGFQSCPVTIISSGIKQDINVAVSNGFTIDKTVVTPKELKDNGGKYNVRISTKSVTGTTGTVIFSKGTTPIDTVNVKSVGVTNRYSIENRSAAGLKLGNHSKVNAPALAVITNDATQKFILRSVNPGVNDSLYYIIQDGDYKFMKKSPDNGWDVIFGGQSDEAKWRLNHQEGGAYTIITNVLTGKDLGTDDIIADSRLWDDKTFVAAPTAKPYCEWKFTEIPMAIERTHSNNLKAFVTGNFVNIKGTIAGDDVLVYNIYGQKVMQVEAESDLTTFSLNNGIYIIRVKNSVLKIVK